MQGLVLALLSLSTVSYARHLPPAFAIAPPENGLGGITGKITGDLQPCAKVTVFVLQHDKVVDKTETDEDGFYKFRYLEEGTYDLKAVKDGYRICIVTQIPVAPDRVTKLNFYLPKINNDHMPDYPIVESYDYYYRYMKHPDVSYPR